MLNLLAFFFKNLALVLGVVEAIIKLLIGLAHLTKFTKKDDKWMDGVNKAFSKMKKFLYDLSDAKAEAQKQLDKIRSDIDKQVKL